MNINYKVLASYFIIQSHNIKTSFRFKLKVKREIEKFLTFKIYLHKTSAHIVGLNGVNICCINYKYDLSVNQKVLKICKVN